MLFEAEYRRFQGLRSGKAPIAVRLTHQESLAVAQVEPPGFELSRAGRRYHLGNSGAITGIAPVQVLPTTAAQWLLWNQSTTRAHCYEELGVYLTSGTPGVAGILLAALVQAPASVGANVAGATCTRRNNGASGNLDELIVKTGVTITNPATPTWYPIASNPSPNVTAFAGSVFLENRLLGGDLIVQPGQGLALCVIAPAGTTPLFAPFAKFFALETDLE